MHAWKISLQKKNPQEPRWNKSHTTQFKLQVIKEARETSKRAAARRFRVDTNPVQEWVVSEDKAVW